jgi:hypothetical protein
MKMSVASDFEQRDIAVDGRATIDPEVANRGLYRLNIGCPRFCEKFASGSDSHSVTP